MTAKKVIITGANSGIGKAAAIEIAKAGHNVIMVCRNKDKGQAAQADIKETSGNKRIDLELADLSLMAEVKKLATRLKKKYQKFDVLLNNAGLVGDKKRITTEGLENQLATNHMAPFILTNSLLKNFKPKARIITVSSGGHWFGRLNVDNLNGEKFYNNWLQYCNTKLFNILFTRGLAKRLEGKQISANCLHPGPVHTGFASANVPEFVHNLAGKLMLSAEEGAQTSIYLTLSDEVEGISGKYFVKCKEAKPKKSAFDDNLAEQLWQASEAAAKS